ncbi:hypothetical protein EJ110_NYTH58643 [Nymphaea thermarum]|nr:hypothetical protein EJ110_NYTH58643 [Nymphaea thermarum]
MSIMEYLGRLKGIADQLGVAGYVVSNKEKVQQTLSGLGPYFYAFTTALEVLPILPTFNELQGKLLQHEMNMQQLMRGTNQGNAHNVLVMEAAAGHRKGNRAHQGGMNRGHDEQTGKGILPTPSVTRRFQTNTTKKVPTCFQCNKKGHIKANCWFNPQNRSNKPETDAQQILMTALSKMTIKQNDQGEWYLDSGAATHVTGNAGITLGVLGEGTGAQGTGATGLPDLQKLDDHVSANTYPQCDQCDDKTGIQDAKSYFHDHGLLVLWQRRTHLYHE